MKDTGNTSESWEKETRRILLPCELVKDLEEQVVNQILDAFHSIAKQERQKGREEAVSYIDKNLMYGRDSAKNLVIHPDNLTLTLERAARTNPQEGEKKV